MKKPKQRPWPGDKLSQPQNRFRAFVDKDLRPKICSSQLFSTPTNTYQ